jgi:hypothetical protein
MRNLFAVLVAICFLGMPAQAQQWVLRQDGRTMAGLLDIGGRLVAFGTGAALWTSENGTEWIPRFAAGNPQVVDMAWSGKLLVGITANGTAVTSTDGVTWQVRKEVLSTGTKWSRIVWAKDSFSIFSGHSQVARMAPNFNVRYTSLSFGGTLKQIHASDSQLTMLWYGPKNDSIATSRDGVSWTRIPHNLKWIGHWLDRDDKGWIAAYRDTLVRSEDLSTWSITRMVNSLGGAQELARVFRVGNRYFGTYSYPRVLNESLDDGKTWREVWICPGASSLGGTILRTPTKTFYRMTPGLLLALPDSTGGLRVQRDALFNFLEGVGYKHGKLVVTGNYYASLESTDGKSWTILDGLHEDAPIGFAALADFGDSLVPIGADYPRFLSESDSIYGIGGMPRFGWHGGGRQVVVGDAGMLISSLDGQWWEDRKVSDANLSSGGWRNGLHVAVGDTILTSPDGVTWTGRPRAKQVPLASVVYGAGMWLAVGSGSVQTSSDGLVWSLRKSNGLPEVKAVGYGGGRFVAVGAHGVVVSSTDGVTWDSANVGADVELDDLVWTGTGWVAVGQYGTIFTLGDPVVPPSVSAGPRRGAPRVAATWNGRFLSIPDGTRSVSLGDPRGRILSYTPDASGRIDLRDVPSGVWFATGHGSSSWSLRLVR